MTKEFTFFGKTILIISPEPWDYITVSKHHYALELAKRGCNVFYLNPPSVIKGICIKKVNKAFGLQVIDYPVLIKGQRFLPGLVIRWIDHSFLREIERKAACKFDIVWNFENSRFYDLNFVGRDILKIYHQVDLNQDFHVRKAASTADICFCTTDFIKQRLLKYRKGAVYKIHHGFSGKFFEPSLHMLQGIYTHNQHRKAKAYYIGNLDIRYIDINTLASLVQYNSNVEFVFVGPYSKEKCFFQRLSKFANTTFTGVVKAEAIPELLMDADILLLIYNAEEYMQQLASPHKMMEYLASGKVVVASYTDEYKDKRNLLLMADKKEEIPALFSYAQKNLRSLNAQAEMTRRIQFAQNHTYSKQLDKIEQLIKESLFN